MCKSQPGKGVSNSSLITRSPPTLPFPTVIPNRREQDADINQEAVAAAAKEAATAKEAAEGKEEDKPQEKMNKGYLERRVL